MTAHPFTGGKAGGLQAAAKYPLYQLWKLLSWWVWLKKDGGGGIWL